MPGLASATTVTTVGLLCKAFLSSRLAHISVTGLPKLLNALENDDRRRAGQGVITISNHVSTLDDPLTWGILPSRCYRHSHLMRWSLGAADIMFTNPLFSTFFRLGQVLETFRGKGIYQPAVDTAIGKLNNGGWIHLFGEGKVNQFPIPPSAEDVQLPRFKWGVGRILMEATVPPIVIPMWLTGFEQIMPEGRKFPYKYIPRIGARISVTFGDPLPIVNVQRMLSSPTSDVARTRSEITAVLHDSVQSLGNSVLKLPLPRSTPL